MSALRHNLRFAFRQLGRNRGFSLAVIVTLALAIGANTAIFSIVNALLLTSLPYPQPDRMGTIFRHTEGSDPGDSLRNIDGAQWTELRDNVPALISAISGATSGVNLQVGDRVAYVQDGRVSQHYFDVLGIRLAAGRKFTAAEDQPHGTNVAILSYGLWRNVFQGDPNIVRQAIHLKGQLYTVIGILPQGATTPLNADLFTPLQPSASGEGGGINFQVITRLRPGATWQQADTQINRAWAADAATLAAENHATRVSFHFVPLQQGQTDSVRPKALALMFAAGLILLIACANLAGLTLIRMTRRTPEIATRFALGATHWQIQKQLWIENLFLAIIGGTAGVAIGYLALHGLLSLLPENYLPVTSVPLDARVLTFTLVVSVLTSVLVGMLPALTSRRVDLRSSMASRAITGGDRLRLRQALIAGEVALTVLLLCGSGLLIRTLIHLETLPPGFNPHGVMTAKASLDDARYFDPAALRKLLDESTAAMRRIPGVQDAAVAVSLPYERILNDTVALRDGPDAGQKVQTDEDCVTPDYFATLQIPLLAGRYFTASDGPNTHPVAIVNQTFARKFYRSENPIGHVFNNGVLIVGVVADTQISSGLDPIAPLQTEETIYIPATEVNPRFLPILFVWFQPSWVVRTAGPIQGLTGQMQRALAGIDPGLPFSGFYSMSDLLDQQLASQRIQVALLGTMAALALLLSAIGIFALVANIVAQRTREIGIRLALGSSVREAIIQIGAPGIRAAGVGLAGGLLLSAASLRVMGSVLYGVGIYDSATLIAVVLTLAAVTLLATALPALRVARIDPATTLREE